MHDMVLVLSCSGLGAPLPPHEITPRYNANFPNIFERPGQNVTLFLPKQTQAHQTIRGEKWTECPLPTCKWPGFPSTKQTSSRQPDSDQKCI